MIYYKEEKKELIIPSGFQYDGCGGSDCEYEIEQAYQSGWTNGYNSGITSDCGEAIEEAYQSGYTAGLEDCPECSGGTCNLETRNISLNNSFDGDETITPTQGYDGFDSVRIVDNGYGQSKYDEGYQSGKNDINLVIGNFGVSDFWPGDTTVYPAQGEDGYRFFRIYDNGYGLYKYNSGYSAGYSDGDANGYDIGYQDGYAEGQADCSGGTPCDCSSAITEAYQSGYTEGYADAQAEYPQGTMYNAELDSGWTGLSDILPGELVNEIVITDNGYGDAKYQEGYYDGYAQGQADCDCSSAITEAYDDGYNQGYSDGNSSGYTNGFNQGFSSGRTVGRREGYYQGEKSVIQSFLTGNAVTNYGGIYRYGYVVAYYYTPSGQVCVITGYDRNCSERWDDAFSSMSVDGGPWVSPQLYYYFSEGWHQIRFIVKDPYLHDAFNHNFPTEYVEDPFGNLVIPYMDALKAVSLPEANQYQSGVTGIIGTFEMNNGIRILSTSLKFFGVQSGNTYNGNALSGATNLNMIISHYEGNENVDILSAVQNGILFYPKGKASTHSSTLTGWTHMELF